MRYNGKGENSGITDYGPQPFVTDIEKATCRNNNFRTALWTGCHLQLTLMCIPAGGEIGLEMHSDIDQFIRLESGNAIVKMGCSKNNLNFEKSIGKGYAVLVPAGTWHNIINTGCSSIKVYSVYAPPKHPHGTVHKTKRIADANGD